MGIGNEADVAIVGGGLAGLTAALDLGRRGLRVALFEQKHYPMHRVCGEYVSNEVLPYLESLGVHVSGLGAHPVHRLFATGCDGGETWSAPLPLGGFGLSRYVFEWHLVEQARAAGVRIFERTPVRTFGPAGERMRVVTEQGGEWHAAMVLCATGKRSRLDRRLDRRFMDRPTPWMAVKYHVQGGAEPGVIALHSFDGGYCGVVGIEGGLANVCYLAHERNLGDGIAAMEREVLSRNPWLARLFRGAQKIDPRPLAIARISFADRSATENHALMVGDAAGLVTPLCGNGMAMAIGAARLAAESAAAFLQGACTRAECEREYAARWRKAYRTRILAGRLLQPLMGEPRVTDLALRVLRGMPRLARPVIRATHGAPLRVERS